MAGLELIVRIRGKRGGGGGSCRLGRTGGRNGGRGGGEKKWRMTPPSFPLYLTFHQRGKRKRIHETIHISCFSLLPIPLPPPPPSSSPLHTPRPSSYNSLSLMPRTIRRECQGIKFVRTFLSPFSLADGFFSFALVFFHLATPAFLGWV